MKTAATLIGSRTANIASTLALAALWVAFAGGHVRAWQQSGDWSYLLFCASETLTAALFILRSEPAAVSHSPLDWTLAIAATMAPMLFSPTPSESIPQGRVLMVLAVVVQLAGLLSLNRSFGLVAARRVIKTTGMYRIMRHPLYASYLVAYLGYVMVNPSLRNILIGSVGAVMLVFRLQREERFLSLDATYRIYMRQVKYRLLPMVF